jgi:hypothetical protein
MKSTERAPTKSALSPARRRLVELLQTISFGRVERLVVRCGEPDWSAPPRILRDIRIGKACAPHAMRSEEDFALRGEVTELFALFDREGSLDVEVLEVQHGLPHRVVVATEARP